MSTMVAVKVRILQGLYDFIEVNFHMLTPEDRIIEHQESDIERLKLERDELKDELQILKKMIEDATNLMKK